MKTTEPPRVQAARRRGDNILKINGRHFKITAVPGGYVKTEVKPMGFWAARWEDLKWLVGIFLGAIVLSSLGCGGAAFVYGLDPSDASAPESSVVDPPSVDSGADASEGSDKFGGHPPSEAGADTGRDPDVSPPIEAGPDAAPVDASPTCTPIPPTTNLCGVNNQVIASPTQWCWLTGFGGPSPQGNVENTPAKCRCLETYDCACVLGFYNTLSCGGAGGTTTPRCSDGAGFPVVQCP